MTELITGRPLYKRDSKGQMRVWYMIQDGDRHQTVAGLKNGQLTFSEWTVCIGKQGRTDEEQAAFEINSGYEYQLKREYFETPEEADGPARFFKPMLAEKWQDIGWEKAQQLIAKGRQSTTSLVGTGIYHQPKLDGFCCIAQITGLTSREGQPIVSAPHIMSALSPFFREFPEAILHGELYNHDLHDDFQELSSVLKKQKPTDDDLAKSAQLIQFHVYDYPSQGALPFGERHELLIEDLSVTTTHLGGSIRLVPTFKIHDEHMLETMRVAAVEDGYEGQIIRLDLPYEQKRSKSVLKNKVFDDGEFEVVSIEPGKGNWAGHAKRVTCWLPNADRSQGPNKENTFGAGIKGKKPVLKELLTQEHKVVTIRHFGWTSDGKPRMGVAQTWHGDGRSL